MNREQPRSKSTRQVFTFPFHSWGNPHPPMLPRKRKKEHQNPDEKYEGSGAQHWGIAIAAFLLNLCLINFERACKKRRAFLSQDKAMGSTTLERYLYPEIFLKPVPTQELPREVDDGTPSVNGARNRIWREGIRKLPSSFPWVLTVAHNERARLFAEPALPP